MCLRVFCVHVITRMYVGTSRATRQDRATYISAVRHDQHSDEGRGSSRGGVVRTALPPEAPLQQPGGLS